MKMTLTVRWVGGQRILSVIAQQLQHYYLQICCLLIMTTGQRLYPSDCTHRQLDQQQVLSERCCLPA